MVKRLNLSGNELLCYAVIYGFSQDGDSLFMGSLKYLQDWMNVSQPTVLKALRGLMDKGLIKKQEIVKNKVKLCYYQAVEEPEGGTKDSLEGVLKEFKGGTKDSLPGGTKESLDNNTIYNNIDNIKSISNDIPKNPQQTSFLDPAVNEKEVNYNKWLIKDFPRIVKMKEPLSYKHFCILRDKYGEDMILSKMEALDNDSQYYKKKISAYRTLNNWCREDSRRGDYGK